MIILICKVKDGGLNVSNIKLTDMQLRGDLATKTLYYKEIIRIKVL